MGAMFSLSADAAIGDGGQTVSAAKHRIALFTDSDAFAGTERHILDLAHGLREMGVCVQIACPASSPLAQRARETEMPMISIPKCGRIDYRAARKLSALLRAGEINLVHAHNGRTVIAATLGVWLAGMGCTVFTQHFVEPGRLKCGRVKRLMKSVVHKVLNRRIDHFIAISTAVRDAMLSRADAPLNRITTVLNGISRPNIEQFQKPESLRAQYHLDANAPLVVCVARLEAEKDIPSLIEAMQSLVRTNPELRCIVVGEGSQRDELERRIRTTNLEGRVLMAGFRKDAMAVINAGDVFVLPSPAEPFGLVILEAMALGKPVVAIMKGGPAEIVIDGTTGLLVPESDPSALAAAIRSLIEAPEERNKMGRAGQQRIEECFSAHRMARETVSAYDKALRQPKTNK